MHTDICIKMLTFKRCGTKYIGTKNKSLLLSVNVLLFFRDFKLVIFF